jgi:uncharacterized protein (DUF952 family)
MIYHITQVQSWQAAGETGSYVPPGFKSDGFIHCCAADQIAEVGNRYFRGETDLVLLCIDPQRVAGEVRTEDLTRRGIAYPHIYGPLDVAAVLAVLQFPPEPDGTFKPPSDLT